VFGRFICPALLAPHVHGLLEEPPNQNCQRYLILLSKTLQHLAYGTLPGRKEEFLQRLSEFITSNQEPLQNFLEQITTLPDNLEEARENEFSIAIPSEVKYNSLAFTHHHISTNEALVKRYCDEQPNGKELNMHLTSAMEKLGSPIGPKSS